MNESLHALALILVMAAVTAGLRLLPFVLLGRRRSTPRAMVYLGGVLPFAIMGMLVVYCLRDVSLTRAASVLPAAIGVALTAGLHLWKRNTLLSILCGTVCYMLLVQWFF